MTDKLTLYAPRLVASLEDRTLSGLLLPFGEPGHTNLGKLTASAESKLDVAPDVILSVQHDRNRPVGKAMELVTADDGLRAAFHVLETRDGDDALLEAEAGVRCGLSVEIEPVVVRSGRIVGGTIVGAGLVVEPAFPSARLAAADLPPVPDMGESEPDNLPRVVIDGEALEYVADVTVSEDEIDITTKTPDAPTDAPANPEGTAMTAAAVVTNAALVAAQKPKLDIDRNRLFAALAANANLFPGQDKLTAALSDVVPGDILGIEQPQYVGELWSGKAYERRIVPLYNHADLTSFRVEGWRWVTKPEVDAYEGNKGPVPSNEIETEPVGIDAYRLAGAHDIDRKFRDFSSPEFWDAYYRAMTESTAKKSDVAVRKLVAAGASRVHLLSGTAPAGVPTALWQIVRGIRTIIDTLEVIPDHALVESDYWEPIMFTPATDVLVYLDAMLGLKEGTLGGQGGGFKIIPVPVGALTVDLATDFVGKVLVGCKDAVTVHELGGGAPIRVEAPNITQGGVDSGVFYYGAVNIHSEDGLVLFDAPTAA